MKLPKAVKRALKLLEEAGYEAVVVGGAVRDYLLGKTPNDYDISTNARPEEVKEVFKNFHTLDIGIKHGTVTVFIDRRQLEITTYRSERITRISGTKEVVFETDLDADLGRRDFTVNAICYNRRIIDKVGGIADLQAKLIRAIGDPSVRFREDPLRILRALRFAAVLNFRIESGTRDAIIKEKELLRKVSSERINLEFSKLLLGETAPEIIEEYAAVLRVFLPELPEELALNLKALPKLDGLASRLASLLVGAEPGVAEGTLKRLKYPKNKISQVLFLLANKDREIKPELSEIGKFLKDFESADLLCLLGFQKAFLEAEGRSHNLDEVLKLAKQIDPGKCYRLKDLAVSGRDLLAMGYPEGAGIRILLDKLLDLVIEGRLKNEKEELLGYLEKNNPPAGKCMIVNDLRPNK